MVLVAKKLKKNNVAIDVISYGNVDENKDKLTQFITTVNNNENSHLMTVELGYMIIDALFSSSILNGEEQEMGGGMVNLGGSGAQDQPNPSRGVALSQFEMDMEKAIQDSLMEEQKKLESQTKKTEEQNNTTKTGPEHDEEMNPLIINEDDMDDEEIAKRLSLEEHEKQMKDKLNKESKLTYFINTY